MNGKLVAILILSSLCRFAVAGLEGTACYQVIDLGGVQRNASAARDIDAAGRVVGWFARADGTRRAFLYDGKQFIELGTLRGGTRSHAAGLNATGQIIGHAGINEYGPSFEEIDQAFVLENDAMRSLGALHCPCDFNRRYGTSVAHAINGSGQVVGESETIRGTWVRHAFLWQGGVMQDIGGGAGDWSISRAYAINDLGQVVGDFAQDAGRLGGGAKFDRRAFLWQAGTRTDLATLPGHSSSTALAINDTTQVVGWSGNADASISRAFLWQNGQMRDLGVLLGHTRSQALGINAAGHVVGWSGTGKTYESRAVLWDGERLRDLNDHISRDDGWRLLEAVAINDAGQIVGTGWHRGQSRAFLLIPKAVPPSSPSTPVSPNAG